MTCESALKKQTTMSSYYNYRRLDDKFDRFLDNNSSFGLGGLDPFSFRESQILPRYRMNPLGYSRNWYQDRESRPEKTNVEVGKDGFTFSLDVQQFTPSEITVKTVDNYVLVEGKHEEKQDDHGFISRQFSRKYLLPKDVCIKDVVSTLSSDGVLTIKAPSLVKPVEDKERVIPIQQTGPAHPSVKDAAKPDF